MSYFAQFTGIEKHIKRLPWRKRLQIRWHLWRLARYERRIIRKAKSVVSASTEST